MCEPHRGPEKATDRERAFAKVLQALQADVTPAFEFKDGALCPRFQKVMAGRPRCRAAPNEGVRRFFLKK